MTKEALKLALEALKMADELCRGHGVDFKEYGLEFDRDIQVKYKDAITAIKEALAQPERDYERGFIDGMQKQMQSSVDKAVNAMSQRTWVGLTDVEILAVNMSTVTKLIDEPIVCDTDHNIIQLGKAIEAKLKEKNDPI